MVDCRDRNVNVNMHYYRECNCNCNNVAHRIAIERIPRNVVMTDGKIYRSTGYEVEFIDGSCWDEYYNIHNGEKIYFH